jgi:exopolysaccharide biosynthesis operon protein EpsL
MAHSDSGSSQPANGASGSAPLRRTLLALLPAGLLAAPLPAAALFNDRVELFAAENVTWDNNVYRLDDRTGNVVSDRISTTSLGITGNIPVSLQTFQFAYTWFATRYNKIDDLNFNGHTARAAWLWAITPRLTGDVGYGESQTLANFAQFVGNRTKDVIRTRQAYANAVWFATPSWRVNGATGWSDQKHDDPARKLFDIETTTGEAGITYVTAQDNRLGVALRGERGKSKDAVVNPLQAPIPDNSYKQAGAGITGHWVVTGHSTLDGHAEYTRREYDVDSRRDYSGPTLRLTHTWTPTGKIEVLSTLRREISPIDEVQSSNFVLVKGASVKPKWKLTDKITLSGSAEYAIWNYRADALLQQASYEHRVRSFALGILYRFSPRFMLQGGYLHEKRTSSLPIAGYDVDVFNVEGRISF